MVKELEMKTFLIVTVAFLIGTFAFAQSRAVSYESITVADTAIGITPSTLTLVLANGQCSGRLETGQIRFRVDGTDPTDSEGILLEVGELIKVTQLTNLLAFKAIRTGATSGVLKIHCFQ